MAPMGGLSPYLGEYVCYCFRTVMVLHLSSLHVFLSLFRETQRDSGVFSRHFRRLRPSMAAADLLRSALLLL